MYAVSLPDAFFRAEERGVRVGEPSDLIALELERRVLTGVFSALEETLLADPTPMFAS